MSDNRRADISMHHIPVRGGIGTGLIVGFIVFLMIRELPQLRWPVIAGAVGGLLLGGALIIWRGRRIRLLHPRALANEPSVD